MQSDWKELLDPIPLPEPSTYSPLVWPVTSTKPLPVAITPPGRRFFEVVESRITRREFSLLDDASLSSLLWHSCRTKEQVRSNYGFALEHRPVQSAGAIHPIHLLIGSRESGTLARYDPVGHMLETLDSASVAFMHLWNEAQEVLDASEATIVIFAAEPRKTAAKYANPSSLVWRDAGVLLGHLALVSEALNINFVPLGITGDRWIKLLDYGQPLVGVGVALIGARSTAA